MSPAGEVRIRPMTAADLGRVMEIARSLKDAPHWPLATYLDALDAKAALKRIALVAEGPAAGGAAGFAIASLVAPQAELETIVAAAESQRRGVARRLFAVLVEEFGRRQVTEVILEVRASNQPALAFYQGLGFEETGRRLRYYADPVEDALLMSLRIK